jgi:hypothetical protein
MGINLDADMVIDDDAFEVGFKLQEQYNNVRHCVVPSRRKYAAHRTQRYDLMHHGTQQNVLLYSAIDVVTNWGWTRTCSTSTITRTMPRERQWESILMPTWSSMMTPRRSTRYS